jgi:adenylate cyclase
LSAVCMLVLLYTIPYAHLMFRQFGIIVNLVYPPITIILAAIVGYAYRYMTEFRQKTKVATALGQFVNADVAQGVLDSTQNRVEKRGEKRQITVIFTDIKGFTTISENLQAQSVVALLNEYLEVMSQVIVRNNGIVDKYEGDAVMAFFEEKDGLPSHELRAAQAALDMRAELPKLLEKWRNDPPLPGGETKPDIDFRVGVSSGEAIVGTIGSSEHIQYTAIGDIVNLGSRLEGANKKYETNILLAEATYEAIKNSFECRYVDVIKVKGKNHAVKTYQLICRKGDLPADQAELIAAYDKGIKLYFERKFQEATDHFQNEVLKKWPRDYLATVYAARAQKCVLIPPAADWDFVYKMESK